MANTGTGSITGIETLSMADVFGGAGNDSLKVNSADIIALGTGTFDPAGAGAVGALTSQHAVRIDGDSGDTLNLSGGGWSLQTGVSNAPSGYDVYVHLTSGHEDAYALVQHLIGVTLGG